MPPGGFPPMQPAPPPEPMLRPAEGDRRKAKPRKAQGDRWALMNSIVGDVGWDALPPVEAKVLLYLFRFAMGDRIRVSINQIAERNGIGRTTAKRAIAALRNRGYLTVTSKGSNLTQEANEYRISAAKF